MAIQDDWTIDYSAKTITHTAGTTTYSANEMYSWLMDVFDEQVQMDDDVPMSAQTPVEYTLIQGWSIPDASYEYLKGGAITDVLNDAIWANPYTLGTIEAGTEIYIVQDGTKLTKAWVADDDPADTGHIDALIKVQDGGVLINEGYVTVFARQWNKLYDHFPINLSAGGRNAVPLATANDLNNLSSTGTVGGYSDITFAFGFDTKDLGNGNGAVGYNVVIDCATRPLSEVYEYLKYVARRTATTPIFTEIGIDGEQYIGTEVLMNYDSQTGNFTEGLIVTGGTSGASAYILSDEDNGVTGTLTVVQVKRGPGGANFSAGETITDTGTGSASINGAILVAAPVKQSPFGTFAGGTFFGALGVWIENYAGADAKNFQLIDLDGATQSPPNVVAVTVSSLVAGDKVGVFKRPSAVPGSGIEKDTYSFASKTSNSLTISGGPISADTPQSGYIRVVDAATGDYLFEYTGFSGSTFTGVTPDPTGEAAVSSGDDVWAPFIDAASVGSEISNTLIYSSDIPVLVRVRLKGILPFEIENTITNAGMSQAAIRTTDSIVT